MKNVEKKIEFKCFDKVDDFILDQNGVFHVFAYTKKGWFILRYVGQDESNGDFYLCSDADVVVSINGDLSGGDPQVVSNVPIKKELIELIVLFPESITKIMSDMKADGKIFEQKYNQKKENVINEIAKPPIGLMPSFIWKEKRIHTIREAMVRYLNEDKRISLDWWNELTDLEADLYN